MMPERKGMKRLTAVILLLTMIMGMAMPAAHAASSNTADAAPWTFDRGITIVCPWGEGGGADSTIRPMSRLLEQYLGVPVEVRNVTGNSGVNGAAYAYEQPADGYTFLLGTQSLYIQALLGKMNFDFMDAFACETVLVHSINMLAASRVQMEKYGVRTFSDLRAYVAGHPGEVSVAMQSAIGVDGMCFEIATQGLALNPVDYQSGTDVNSDLANGLVDLAVGGYDDMIGQIDAGNVCRCFCSANTACPSCPTANAPRSLASTATPGRSAPSLPKRARPAIDAIVEAVEACRADATWKGFVISTLNSSGVSAEDYFTLNGKRIGVNRGSVQADMLRSWTSKKAYRPRSWSCRRMRMNPRNC